MTFFCQFWVQCFQNYFQSGDLFSARVLSPVFSLNYCWFGDLFSARVFSPVFELLLIWWPFFCQSSESIVFFKFRFGDFSVRVLSPVGFKKNYFWFGGLFSARGLSPGFSLNYFWWPFSCQSFESSVFFKLILIWWPFSCQFLVQCFKFLLVWWPFFFWSEFWVQCFLWITSDLVTFF